MMTEYIGQVMLDGKWQDVGDFVPTIAAAERSLEAAGYLGWKRTQIVELKPIVCSCGRFAAQCEKYYNPDARHGKVKA